MRFADTKRIDFHFMGMSVSEGDATAASIHITCAVTENQIVKPAQEAG